MGLDNFAGVVTDRLFTNATVNTLIWTALAIVLPTAGGLTLALMLDTQVPGAKAFKSVFYLPICLAAVVVGQIWIWIYQPDWGPCSTLPSLPSPARRPRSPGWPSRKPPSTR